MFTAAGLSPLLSTALGVTIGAWTGSNFSERVRRYVAGIGCVALGIWTLLRS